MSGNLVHGMVRCGLLVGLLGCPLVRTAADSGPVGRDAVDLQGAVEIEVVSNLTGPVYVAWSIGADGVIFCERAAGGGWTDCAFRSPWCMEECSGGRYCCLGCAPPRAQVLRIDPGDRIAMTWSGEAYPEIPDACEDGCACYNTVAPSAGHYRAGICVHSDLRCDQPSCEDPENDKTYVDSYVDGDETCYHTEFDVVYAEDKLTVLLQ